MEKFGSRINLPDYQHWLIGTHRTVYRVFVFQNYLVRLSGSIPFALCSLALRGILIFSVTLVFSCYFSLRCEIILEIYLLLVLYRLNLIILFIDT
jgi:hypothetical protein